jgi:hypothetical protein
MRNAPKQRAKINPKLSALLIAENAPQRIAGARRYSFIWFSV